MGDDQLLFAFSCISSVPTGALAVEFTSANFDFRQKWVSEDVCISGTRNFLFGPAKSMPYFKKLLNNVDVLQWWQYMTKPQQLLASRFLVSIFAMVAQFQDITTALQQPTKKTCQRSLLLPESESVNLDIPARARGSLKFSSPMVPPKIPLSPKNAVLGPPPLPTSRRTSNVGLPTIFSLDVPSSVSSTNTVSPMLLSAPPHKKGHRRSNHSFTSYTALGPVIPLARTHFSKCNTVNYLTYFTG